MSNCNCKDKCECQDGCNNRPYEIMGITQLNIDDLSSTPDYFLGVREVTDPETGNTLNHPVRIPGERVMPTGNLANVIALGTNNEALTVPENQVRAGYLNTGSNTTTMELASKEHKAMFLMLGKFDNSRMLIQSTGYLTIPKGHKYIVATQYYLGENGEPTAEKGEDAQKLFIPLSDKILLVNGDF